MKWLVLGPGLFLASLIFFNGPPWDASVFHRAPVPALVAAVLTVLLVMSKFTERVAEKVPEALGSFRCGEAVSWLDGLVFCLGRSAFMASGDKMDRALAGLRAQTGGRAEARKSRRP